VGLDLRQEGRGGESTATSISFKEEIGRETNGNLVGMITYQKGAFLDWALVPSRPIARLPLI